MSQRIKVVADSATLLDISIKEILQEYFELTDAPLSSEIKQKMRIVLDSEEIGNLYP
jgi:hypothetical protein